MTSTIVLEGEGRAREYAGGYTDWLAQRPAQPATAAAAQRPAPSPPARVAAPAAFPAKLQRELDRLPERMSAAEEEIALLELRLDDPDLYTRDPAAFALIGEKLASLRGVLATLEDRWLELDAMRESHSA